MKSRSFNNVSRNGKKKREIPAGFYRWLQEVSRTDKDAMYSPSRANTRGYGA